MKSVPLTAFFGLGTVLLAVDCSSNPLVVGREIDGGDATACACLPDAGPGREAGVSEAGPGNSDGGKNEVLPDASPGQESGAPDGATDGGSNDSGAASACAVAGGTCIDGSVACAKNAPLSAQDCPPSPAGAFCCLTPL
jgi:hypothetical protein